MMLECSDLSCTRLHAGSKMYTIYICVRACLVCDRAASGMDGSRKIKRAMRRTVRKT